MAEEVYVRYPALREGELHRLQESLVRGEALAQVGREIALEPMLQLPTISASTLADTAEAVFGAVFLDGGYAAAKDVILRVFAARLAALDPARLDRDPKSRLQEIVQARFRSVPGYRLVRSEGAAHEMRFEVECSVPELELSATGSGSSRQRAEQDAAAMLLEKLER
jgi:ribonuclease III